jgi:glutathione S-transferase
MEPILVYGHPVGSSMGLVAAFEWLGQPYRLARVKMPDDMLSQDYARLNDRQETPVLITDEGRVLTETMAITRWLEHRDTERRISFAPGSTESARMHQLIGFLNTGFTGAFTPYFVAMELAPPDPPYQAALRRFGREQVNNRHRKLEAMIGNTGYLVGDRPTLADAVFVGVARWAGFLEAIDDNDYPRTTALRQRLEGEPAVRFALAIEDGATDVKSSAFRGHIPLGELLAHTAVAQSTL